ncbi:MAG: hypothetical protein HY287_13630 [Planctomycetes bacterium]|nr:hypothetical protein [Planctomycetota bacterium]MBI3835363.1 hypothetical protein [Planctomycetota bacterium]
MLNKRRRGMLVLLAMFVSAGCQSGWQLVGIPPQCFNADAVPDGCTDEAATVRLCFSAPTGLTACVNAPAHKIVCNGQVTEILLECTAFVTSPADIPP